MKIREFINNQNNLKEYSGPLSDVEYAWEEAADDYEDRYGKGSWDRLDPDTQELYYRKKLQKYGWGVKDGKLYQLESKESLKALARHIKEGVPLVDSLFRYQSEAYFDTFKTAKKLREAGSLPELDWESEEMLGTDIGESVVLENGERVWLDVPYLEESAGEYSYTLEYNGESHGYSIHKLTITSPEGETKVVADDFTYFDVEDQDMQAELESWFHKGMGVADASVNEAEDNFVYASDLLYFDKDGKEIGYMDFDGYDNANSGHSEQELQAIAQKFNISPKDGKVVGYFDASDDEVDFSDDSNDETYPEGSIGVYIDSHSKEESIEEAEEGMIGEPDGYYDAEERRQAYNDLQDALAQSSKVEAQYVIDGHCPECPNVEDDEDCYGFGNYGCDEGELTYNNDTVSWKEIKDHDERNAQRQQAKDEYPGDEEVIKGLANMMKNMEDPRQAYQQMQADYPQMGRAQRSSLIAKAKQMAFPESAEIDQIKKLAGLNELDDKRTDIDKIADLLKDAIGPENSGGDMYELYAELESIDSQKADEIKFIAKEIYGVKLEEGKSPHKKGTKKYKKHMAAMHAEAVRGRPKIDGERVEVQSINIGGAEREFIRKGEMWHSTDPKYPMKYGYQTPMGQKIAKGRARDLAKTTPSYQAKLKKNKVMASEAEYNGKDVKLNKPMRQSGGGKKYKVYVKNPKTGRVKKISFGDAGLKTKSGNKKRAKSFAARHNCEKKNDKMKAGYWACRLPRYGLVKGGKWW